MNLRLDGLNPERPEVRASELMMSLGRLWVVDGLTVVGLRVEDLRF